MKYRIGWDLYLFVIHNIPAQNPGDLSVCIRDCFCGEYQIDRVQSLGFQAGIAGNCQLPVSHLSRVALEPLHHRRDPGLDRSCPFAIIDGDRSPIGHRPDGGEDWYTDSVQIGYIGHSGDPGSGQLGLDSLLSLLRGCRPVSVLLVSLYAGP